MDQTWIEFLQQYGYIGIFLFLVVGIAGLPLPDEIMMTFLGYLTTTGKLDLLYTYLSSLLGSAAGITISFVIGSKFGYPFIKRYGSRFFITRRRLKVSQLLFRRYGNWLLLVGYFIPGVRHVTAYLAGITKTSFLRFAIFAYSGAVIWCATFIGLGHFLGSKWETAFALFHHYGIMIGVIVVVAIIVWLIVKMFFFGRKRVSDQKDL
ncbi:DedA family protein [Risungbinella massiliensis]|uniref:DedA family protein n=1 Tax=Risungbinella massiliensis TaxID=1329796 RepID=UPI0005CBE8DD|nr:DedA family protein [Risungbinella massiliensis]